MYSLILATIAALAAAAPTVAAPAERATGALPPLPAGAADGFYTSKVNADGTQTWEFAGPLSDIANSTTSNLGRRDEGVMCNNYGIGSDAEAAAQALVSKCGGGYQWGGKSISVQSGNAVAYGCNYGNGQDCKAAEISPLYDAMFSSCGYGAAGWYSKYDDWKATYGVASSGTGFC